MRLLIISNLYPPAYLGGYEILCRQVCNILKEKGHDITVLTSNHGDLEEHTHIDGIPVIRKLHLEYPFGTTHKMGRQRRLRTGTLNRKITETLLNELNPDLIFIWSQLRLSLGSAIAAENAGCPVVYTMNDDHLKSYVPVTEKSSLKKLIRTMGDGSIYKSTTLRAIRLENVTCISQCLKNIMIEQGIPIPDARVIYQGIPVEQFPMKSHPGTLSSPAKILYVGQLHQYKGVHTVVNAVKKLNHDSPPDSPRVTATIVGAGNESYLDRLEQLINGDTSIILAGKVPHAQLSSVYQKHDIFVFPSIWQEPFGLTHLEAMASGTTVVSTADGGHGEALEDGINALVFEKDNSRSLSSCIERLLENTDLSRELALNARKIVETRFSLQRYVRDLELFLIDSAGDI